MGIRQWPPGHRPCVNGVYLVAPLLVASLLAGCGEGKSAAEKKAPAPPPPAVVVAEVVQRTVPIRSEFVARTDAQDTVEIRARVQAFLEQQHFTEGTMVKKDQVLFTLDKREFRSPAPARAGATGQSPGRSGLCEGAGDRRHGQGQSGCGPRGPEQDRHRRQAPEAAGRAASGAATGLRQCPGQSAGGSG